MRTPPQGASQSTLDAVYVYVVPWSEFPIVPSLPSLPTHEPLGDVGAIGTGRDELPRVCVHLLLGQYAPDKGLRWPSVSIYLVVLYVIVKCQWLTTSNVNKGSSIDVGGIGTGRDELPCVCLHLLGPAGADPASVYPGPLPKP